MVLFDIFCYSAFPIVFFFNIFLYLLIMQYYIALQVSDRINCGVYVFTPEIFTAIQGVSSLRKDRGV